jgi:polysaccharide deacetylase 2 family uncharacterized protein YibQ
MWPLLLLLFLIFSVAALCYVLFFRTVQVDETLLANRQHEHTVAIEKNKETPSVVYEERLEPVEHNTKKEPSVLNELPSVPVIAVEEKVKKKAAPKPRLPRVSIIIDDMGFHPKQDAAFLNLPYDITYSFLPYAPYTATLEEKAYELGHTVLLHLPMQPKSSEWDPGQGALLVRQHWNEQKKIIDADLLQVPHAVGVNNHMGSLFTEQLEPMESVLQYLQTKNMFFIDSVTSGASVGYSTARSLGMKTARRTVFLDNNQSLQLICRQLEQLVQKSEKNGMSIGIGHPYPETYRALKKCLPLYERRVTFVHVADLLN